VVVSHKAELTAGAAADIRTSARVQGPATPVVDEISGQRIEVRAGVTVNAGSVGADR
jgi:hypothetical protein